MADIIDNPVKVWAETIGAAVAWNALQLKAFSELLDAPGNGKAWVANVVGSDGGTQFVLGNTFNYVDGSALVHEISYIAYIDQLSIWAQQQTALGAVDITRQPGFQIEFTIDYGLRGAQWTSFTHLQNAINNGVGQLMRQAITHYADPPGSIDTGLTSYNWNRTDSIIIKQFQKLDTNVGPTSTTAYSVCTIWNSTDSYGFSDYVLGATPGLLPLSVPQGYSQIVDALQALALMDTDVSINRGASIFSVRGGVITG